MSGKQTSQQTRATVSRFLSNVMEPLARIVMRYGYSAREASDVTRWSFVRSFFNTPEFWSGDKPTYVQGAIKSGLPRQQVKQLEALPAPDSAIFAYRQNLAYRVVEGWVNDPEFHADGKPAVLPVTDRNGPSFNKLVMKYGNDVTYQPVLKDLESAGCVETDGSNVVLLNSTYGLHLVDDERMELMGYILRRMVETVDHNLVNEMVEERHLHRVWRQMYIPKENVEIVRKKISEIAIKAGREADLVMSRLAHPACEADVDYVEIGLISSIYVSAAADGDVDI